MLQNHFLDVLLLHFENLRLNGMERDYFDLSHVFSEEVAAPLMEVNCQAEAEKDVWTQMMMMKDSELAALEVANWALSQRCRIGRVEKIER